MSFCILNILWLSLQFASLISLVVFACKLNNLPQIGWCNNSQFFLYILEIIPFGQNRLMSHGIYDNDTQTQQEIVVEQTSRDQISFLLQKFALKGPLWQTFQYCKNDEIGFHACSEKRNILCLLLENGRDLRHEVGILGSFRCKILPTFKECL